MSKVVNSSVVNSWLKTSSADAAKPTYFTSLPSDKEVSVSKNIYEYNDANFKSRVSKVTAGKKLSVKSITRSNGGAYRFQLSNGNYITANKAYVTD